MFNIGDKVYFIGQETPWCKNNVIYTITETHKTSWGNTLYSINDDYGVGLGMMKHNFKSLEEMRLEKLKKIIECIQ